MLSLGHMAEISGWICSNNTIIPRTIPLPICGEVDNKM